MNKIIFVFAVFTLSLFGGEQNSAKAALGITGSYTHPNMAGAWHSTISGNYAYIAAPTADCLTILDISTVTNPTYTGSVCDAVKLDGAYGVFVYGNYAYVTSRTAETLNIIDISNPAAPSIVSTLQDAVNLDTPINVFKSGDYVYVTARYQNRLTAVNVSNPAAPFVASSIQRNNELCGAWDLEIVGNYAYVTARGGSATCPGEGNRLTMINISNPLSMSYTGSVREDEQLNAAYGVDVEGNYAYVTSRGTGPATAPGDRLTIIDVSNPASPAITGTLKDNNRLNGAKGVKVFGFMAYVSAYDSDTLTLVDITDPANPVISDFLQDSTNLDMPYGLSFRGGYSYVSSEGTSQFSIISGITDTILPTLATEAWKPDSSGAQVANGGNVNYTDIDQAGEKVTIYSTASDDSGLIQDHKIRYWKNGVPQPTSSWATGGTHQLVISGPLASGDLIEYQSEATDAAGNTAYDPAAGRYSFTVSIPDCCPASGDCTITANPCYLGGSHTDVSIGVNANTANPLRIILTSDLDLTGTDFNFENQFAGGNKAVFIDGRAPASSNQDAKSVDITGGDLIYPSGGLTIDLSVPDTSTGNGGNLDITGAGGTSSFPGNSNLKIYTQASNFSNGAPTTGGSVDITFTNNTLLSGASVIKTGNTSMDLVDGGSVDLTGSGNIGIDSFSNFISTSSSRKAGDVSITGSGYFKGGIHANSCEGFIGCGQTGGTIDMTGLEKYYAPDCASTVLEAKNGGYIDFTGSGFVDLPGTTATGPGGTLEITGSVLSDCSCLVGGGACRTLLNANNGTVDFTGLSCNETDPKAACPASPLPTLQFISTASNGAENVTPVNLQVSLSELSGSGVSVDYSVTSGTATGDGEDYTLANGTKTILAGDLSANIPIAIVDDAYIESNETIVVTLSNPSGALLGTNTTYTYTIVDNDTIVPTNLLGFAWSENIGWVSFNSKNCDSNGDNVTDNTAYSQCPVGVAMQPYGVSLDLGATDNLAGYAWNEYIGYISFDAASFGSCPGIGNCQPRLAGADFYGWARACSVFQNDCSGALKPNDERGGWDGWIKLRKEADDAGENYGVSLVGRDLMGYAWGGGADTDVIGWICFNSASAGCKISGEDYDVHLENNAPEITGCVMSISDLCQLGDNPAANFGWGYYDSDGDPQGSYQVEISNDNFASAPIYDSGKLNSSQNWMVTPTPLLAYGGTYWYRVNVWDTNDTKSTSSQNCQFDTLASINHRYPTASFAYCSDADWDPVTSKCLVTSANILQFQNTHFDPDSSQAYGGASIDWTATRWDFDYFAAMPGEPSADDTNRYSTHIYTTQGNHVANLKITDSDGYVCWASQQGNAETITIGTNNPKWDETTP